jgi:hypothetical protein
MCSDSYSDFSLSQSRPLDQGACFQPLPEEVGQRQGGGEEGKWGMVRSLVRRRHSLLFSWLLAEVPWQPCMDPSPGCLARGHLGSVKDRDMCHITAVCLTVGTFFLPCIYFPHRKSPRDAAQEELVWTLSQGRTLNLQSFF